MRTACLLVADLPLVAALRAEPDLAGCALGVTSAAGAHATLISVSPRAARRGVWPGHTLAHARTLCAALVARVASPAAQSAARQALVDAALSCSPRAALAAPASGALAREAAVDLDASGITARFSSEAGFAAALGARARRLGLPAAVAIASSRRVARIAARLAATARAAQPADETPTQLVPPGAERAFLAPLPLDLFDPEDPLSEACTRFGLHTLGDLLALPPRALATRLGPRALEWIALARGEASEPPLPRLRERRLVEAIDLDHPIERLQPLLFVLQGLLTRLLARLEARHLGCGPLDITLDLASGAREVRRCGVAAPTRDVRVLVRLAHHALEARRLAAPVQAVHLASEGHPLRRDQLDLFRPAGPSPAALGQTLAALASLCGAERVGAPAVPDALHPDALAMTPFAPPAADAAPNASQRMRAASAAPSRDAAATRPSETRSDFTAALALRALRPPVSAQVRIQQQRPAWLRSAVANGRVVRLAGPWRTTGGWWSHDARFAFDSFDVQTSDGSVVRLRLDHVQRVWQIDAIYD
ncbi:MAG: hypothetical protein OEM49_03545 [Myxococcales bacterium]|nr:hypothetical protein [Myxococcales bacterium]MDH5306223.1 hypothetical protein [Myxococcales bacterium]